jgi:hypothetical protein
MVFASMIRSFASPKVPRVSKLLLVTLVLAYPNPRMARACKMVGYDVSPVLSVLLTLANIHKGCIWSILTIAKRPPILWIHRIVARTKPSNADEC